MTHGSFLLVYFHCSLTLRKVSLDKYRCISFPLGNIEPILSLWIANATSRCPRNLPKQLQLTSWATHKHRRLLDLLVLSITHLRVSFPEQMVLLLSRRSSCGAFGNGTDLSENTGDLPKRSVWTIKLVVCWDSSKLVPASTVWVVL